MLLKFSNTYKPKLTNHLVKWPRDGTHSLITESGHHCGESFLTSSNYNFMKFSEKQPTLITHISLNSYPN